MALVQLRSSGSLFSSFWRSAMMTLWNVCMSFNISPSETLLIQGACKQPLLGRIPRGQKPSRRWSKLDTWRGETIRIVLTGDSDAWAKARTSAGQPC